MSSASNYSNIRDITYESCYMFIYLMMRSKVYIQRWMCRFLWMTSVGGWGGGRGSDFFKTSSQKSRGVNANNTHKNSPFIGCLWTLKTSQARRIYHHDTVFFNIINNSTDELLWFVDGFKVHSRVVGYASPDHSDRSRWNSVIPAGVVTIPAPLALRVIAYLGMM